MARTDSDSWNLASSVGATATVAATSRAVASSPPYEFINNPFAAPLVCRPRRLLHSLVDGDLPVEDDPQRTADRMAERIAVRTRYFDDFFPAATGGGIRQRSFWPLVSTRVHIRLPWPSGTIVYEVDLAKVIDFKSATLADLAAQPTTQRRTVAVDLRDDWPTALSDAGFDADQPTAWIAEGLLAYLPPEAQDALFDNITALSAADSRLSTEFRPTLVCCPMNGHWASKSLGVQRDSMSTSTRSSSMGSAAMSWITAKRVAGTRPVTPPRNLHADNGFIYDSGSRSFAERIFLSAVRASHQPRQRRTG